jgi:adenosylmethionine-8-amino-7-oxononanoate aminotransferase
MAALVSPGGSGAFQQGYRYIGHAAACAGALAVQRRLRDDGLLGRVQPMGEQLGRGLRRAFAEHPHSWYADRRRRTRDHVLLAPRSSSNRKSLKNCEKGLPRRCKAH